MVRRPLSSTGNDALFPYTTLVRSLLQQVRRFQALVGRQQLLERLPAVQGEVFAVAQQRIALALDVASVLALQALVLVTAHVIESIGQVAHDMELVEHNAGVGRVLLDRVAARRSEEHTSELQSLMRTSYAVF